MAKLTGKKKAEFLKRMAAGRRKAARGNPKKRAAKKNTTRKAANKKKRNAKLTGKKKAEFLKRMAAGRRKVARNGGRARNGMRTFRIWAAKPNEVWHHVGDEAERSRKAAIRRFKSFDGKHFPPQTRWYAALPTDEGPSRAPKLPWAKNQVRSRGRKSRRNTDQLPEAAAMFETFHQKKPGRIVEYEQAIRYPDDYAEMGKLIELRFALDESNPDFPLTRFEGTIAVCTPDGANIYFIGGDQSVDFDALDIASDKDFVELGPCTYICYQTVKGFHDFEPTKYWHRFGEEDGIFPVLAYDRLNKTLFLLGGNYRVKYEGIVN